MRSYRSLFVALAIVAALALPAFADTTPEVLPFSQDWSKPGLITADDDWSGVPGIEGRRGDGLTAAAGVDPQTVLAADDPGVVDVNADRNDPDTFTTGGVTEFDGIALPAVALSGSGTASAPYLLISIETTGWQALELRYNVVDIDASARNAVQQVALQYRVGTSGAFTNVPAGYIPDATLGPNSSGFGVSMTVNLPAACNDQPVVQLRILTTDAVGEDEWVAVDDISITATPVPVELMSFTAD